MSVIHPEVVQVIRVECCKGAGVESDPCRTAWQYWTLDGKWLFEIDTWAEVQASGEDDDVR